APGRGRLAARGHAHRERPLHDGGLAADLRRPRPRPRRPDPPRPRRPGPLRAAMGDLVLRPATAADLPTVAELWYVNQLEPADPRALALYIRRGLRPRWPHFQLLGPLPAKRPLPTTDLEVLEAAPGDPELVRWDAEIGGRRRPQDHAYWVRDRGGIPLWLARRGEVIGYGYVQTRSDDLLQHPDALTLGPIGARTEADAAACVLAALGWAKGRAPEARIPTPG